MIQQLYIINSSTEFAQNLEEFSLAHSLSLDLTFSKTYPLEEQASQNCFYIYFNPSTTALASKEKNSIERRLVSMLDSESRPLALHIGASPSQNYSAVENRYFTYAQTNSELPNSSEFGNHTDWLYSSQPFHIYAQLELERELLRPRPIHVNWSFCALESILQPPNSPGSVVGISAKEFFLLSNIMLQRSQWLTTSISDFHQNPIATKFLIEWLYFLVLNSRRQK